MDDLLLAYGPRKGDWIEAYDPETGKLEHIQFDLPIILPPYMLRAARTSEVHLIRGRTKKQLYSLAFMGFPPLIVTAEVLGARFGLHGYRATPETHAATPRSRQRRTPAPALANVANGHH